MRIIRNLTTSPKGAVIALGNFDGVHLGHQEILRFCAASAKGFGVPAAVMVFEPHPREYFAKDAEKLRIGSFRSKINMFKALGIDTVFVVRFNQAFASLTAEQFVGEVLHRQLGVKHVVTGYNFAFGKNRSGTTDYLETQGRELGFGFTAFPPVKDAQGQAISSSAVREYLRAGEVEKAGALLGRRYSIEGRVTKGRQLGRTMGYPTANVALGALCKPRFGVYAVQFTTPSLTIPSTGRGESFDGVASIGIRPTLNDTEPLLEVHGFDMNRDLYGQRISVEFVRFIRDEYRFDGIDALRKAIDADCIKARAILHDLA